MLNTFIYDVARAHGLSWLRGYTHVRKTKFTRRVKLWLVSGSSAASVIEFKKTILAAVPHAEITTINSYWGGSSISISF